MLHAEVLLKSRMTAYSLLVCPFELKGHLRFLPGVSKNEGLGCFSSTTLILFIYDS
jgi:hypothetical protein